MISQILDKKNIKLSIDTKDKITLKAYPSELMQVIFTIVNNSKDAFEGKEIQDKLIQISSYQNNECIFLSFEDNAGGINEILLEKIFEPYFTTKHQSQGTGLRLHMTYNLIVEGMKGTIDVKNVKYIYNNNEYSGAKFSISIPIN